MTKTTPAHHATVAAHQCVPALSLLSLQVACLLTAFITATNTAKRSKNKAHYS
jgi:hypothetical protein